MRFLNLSCNMLISKAHRCYISIYVKAIKFHELHCVHQALSQHLAENNLFSPENLKCCC